MEIPIINYGLQFIYILIFGRIKYINIYRVQGTAVPVYVDRAYTDRIYADREIK